MLDAQPRTRPSETPHLHIFTLMMPRISRLPYLLGTVLSGLTIGMVPIGPGSLVYGGMDGLSVCPLDKRKGRLLLLLLRTEILGSELTCMNLHARLSCSLIIITLF